MSQRILITGGFGYLGGRIAVALAQQTDWIIRLSSRQMQPAPAWLPQAEVAELDLLNINTIKNALIDINIVIHLAAMNENDCVISPDRAIEINTLGSFHLLQSAIALGVKRFIYFSTAHIYGAPLVGEITELTLPRPIHPYAITHKATEDFVLAANDQKKIIGTVIRLSNGFGAPTHAAVDRWTLLVNDLCKQAVVNRRLVLHSSGLQQRDFITLTDVSRAVLHSSRLDREDLGNGIFNVGGDNALTIWQMTQKIAERCEITLGYRPELIRPEPQENEKSANLNYIIDRLKNTGFILEGDIDSEIDETLRLCQRDFLLK